MFCPGWSKRAAWRWIPKSDKTQIVRRGDLLGPAFTEEQAQAMFPDPVLLMGLFQPLFQLAFAPDPNDTRNRSFGERETDDFLGCLNLVMKNVALETFEEARVHL